MSKEYMFYIRNEGDAKKELSEEIHLQFVKKCESYIIDLQNSKQLIAAQPINREGVILKKTKSGWTEQKIDTNQEIQVGYYHIIAENLEAAIEIAKRNPEFEFVSSASIEIHSIKTKEKKTAFEYPK